MSHAAINHLGMLYTYKFVLTCRKLIWQIVLVPVIWEIATVTIRHVLNTQKPIPIAVLASFPVCKNLNIKPYPF